MVSERQCAEALLQVEDELMQKPNVVGLGISGRDERGEPLIGVYVSRKVPRARLRDEDVVPQSLRLRVGRRTVELRTEVIEIGRPEPEGEPGLE